MLWFLNTSQTELSYRRKWISAQRAQAETQKMASRMEQDMLETLRANIEAMKNSELEIDKLSAQKVNSESAS